MVKTPADLFDLTTEQIAAMPRMGEKSAANVIDAIAQSKKTQFSRFLFALGIRHVGEEVARILASNYSDLDALSQEDWAALIEHKATVQKENAKRRGKDEALEPVPLEGLGPEIIASVEQFFSQRHNRDVLDALMAAGIQWSDEAKVQVTQAACRATRQGISFAAMVVR